ncbi:hypothetical protein JOM56_010887 [Amanita muscaria]
MSPRLGAIFSISTLIFVSCLSNCVNAPANFGCQRLHSSIGLILIETIYMARKLETFSNGWLSTLAGPTLLRWTSLPRPPGVPRVAPRESTLKVFDFSLWHRVFRDWLVPKNVLRMRPLLCRCFEV